MTATRIAAGAALFAAAAWGQADQRTWSLAGTVSNSLTGEPVVRAHVVARCRGDAGSPEQRVFGVLTTEQGKFSVGPLPLTSCTLSADRVGFLPAGTREHSSGSAPSDGVKITLTPTGAISGRVLNAAGDPVSRVQVMVQGSSMSSSVTTDDRGQFRASGLSAGKYRVRATPQEEPFPPEIRSDGTREMHDAATYFPDSLTAATAQRVEVKSGAEVGSVDIRLARLPIVEVSGVVTGMPAGSSNRVVIQAMPGGSSLVKDDGTFSLWRLDPGKYTLVAQTSSSQTQIQSAPLEIEVGSNNLAHLELHMIPPFDVSGTLRFDDPQAREPAQPPARAGQTAAPRTQPRRLTLRSVSDYSYERSASGTIANDDTFTLDKVAPGQYRVQLSWGSAYVKSVRAGDRESDGDILDLRNGSPGVIILSMSSDTCEVSGTVNGSGGPVTGATIVAVRTDEASDVQYGRSDTSGKFTITGLTPGKYKLAATDNPIGMRGPRGEVLDDFDNVVDVDLRPGDKIIRDLKKE